MESQGIQRRNRRQRTWTYKGSAPESCQLNLEGRVFMYTKEGKVIDLDYGWVGHFRE